MEGDEKGGVQRIGRGWGGRDGMGWGGGVKMGYRERLLRERWGGEGGVLRRVERRYSEECGGLVLVLGLGLGSGNCLPKKAFVFSLGLDKGEQFPRLICCFRFHLSYEISRIYTTGKSHLMILDILLSRSSWGGIGRKVWGK